MSRKKQNVYAEMVQWLETHESRYPRSVIKKDGKFLKVEEMSQEEREETNLYFSWYHSEEYKAFKACKGIPLENLPSEYEQYREQIAILRRYEQIRKEKVEKKNVYNKILQWLETHNGRYPRGAIIKDGKVLKVEEMSQEERDERNLYARWYHSEEYKAFKACKGIPLENLPSEYEQYREQIAILRRYEQIRKEKAEKKNVYKEMLHWLETHEGRYPRSVIKKDGKFLKVEEMSQEEREETNLYVRWKRSEEHEAFKACEGIPLENLPTEYESYREQIATLRRCEQIRKEKVEKKNVYNKILQWLETHNGRYPRGAIIKDGKVLKVEEMSQEERDERNLYARWYHSEEYEAFKACKGIPLENLPAEYEAYREKIATLRRYEQIRKEKAVEKRMRRSVARQVKNNASTRSELQGIVTQLEEGILEEEEK